MKLRSLPACVTQCLSECMTSHDLELQLSWEQLGPGLAAVSSALLGTRQLVTSHDSRGGRPLLKVITSYTSWPGPSLMISCRKLDTRGVWGLSKLIYSRLNYTELTPVRRKEIANINSLSYIHFKLSFILNYIGSLNQGFPDILRDNKDRCKCWKLKWSGDIRARPAHVTDLCSSGN